MSPTVIYNTVLLRNEDSDPCQDKLCQDTYEFTWLGTEPCNSSFICTDLTGDPCADYAVVLSREGSSSTDPVCHQGQIHLGYLSQLESIEVTIWFAKQADYEANCYLWCTNEDSFAGAGISDSSTTAVEELFLELVIYNNLLKLTLQSQSYLAKHFEKLKSWSHSGFFFPFFN